MGLGATKPVFGVFDKATLKPVSSVTETSKKNEILLIASLYNDSFQNASNKGADQSAWMRRLVCAFVDRTPRR